VQILVLLPLFFSIYYISKKRLDLAFLNVYLPCTFLVPSYFNIRIPHLPILSAGCFALIPIWVAVLMRGEKLKFKRMDLWVGLFLFSFLISELFREYSPKDGMILWMAEVVNVGMAYWVGRQVIEPNLRLETIKRIVFLFMIQTPFALFEFRFGQNPWVLIAHNVFGLWDVGWFVQLRGGRARIATSFSDAILAGMMFVVAFALNYYLVQIYKIDQRRLGPKMSLLQKYRLPFFLLPAFVYMTGSRMPEACAGLCFLFLQIPRFKTIRTGVITILLIVVVGGGIAYTGFQRYTSVSDDQVTDEAQSSAIYRKQLALEYAPILEEGGWLGYGVLSHPQVIGMGSIDNNYILTQLSQGKLGLYTFYLIAVESVLTLGLFVFKFQTKESQFLVFSLMGAIVATFVALYTVYMGEQVPQVLFMIIGWAQSLQDTSVFGAGVQAATGMPEPKFRFRRVIAS